MRHSASEVTIAIRAEMLRQRMTVTELAEATGIGRVSLHRRFNGTVAFNTDELAAISKALVVPLSELIRRAEDAA